MKLCLLLANREVFPPNNTELQTQQCPRVDKWLQILTVEDLHQKNSEKNFSESNEEKDGRVHRLAVEPESE